MKVQFCLLCGSIRRRRRLFFFVALISGIAIIVNVLIYLEPSNLTAHRQHHHADRKPERVDKTVQDRFTELDSITVTKVEAPSRTNQNLRLTRQNGWTRTQSPRHTKKNELKATRSRKVCSLLPNVSSIEISNSYWQNLVTPERTFKFFTAYYDTRKANDTPCVRIISMTNYENPDGNYCQLWFSKIEIPLIVKVKTYDYMWRKDWAHNGTGNFEPYLITCQLPKSNTEIPTAVSIVAHECDNATNMLKVSYDHGEPKRDFAVCVKSLNFPDQDISVRLVEWIELLSLLGNDMIYFYTVQVHPNVTRLLEHYEGLNRVRVVPMTPAGPEPILQHSYLRDDLIGKRHNEMVVFNDCFYRNMNAYRYVAILDIDEVIMPLGDLTSWQQLVAAVEEEDLRRSKKHHAALFARNVFFFDTYLHLLPWTRDIPKYLHMLQHVYRATNLTIPETYFIKSFFNTELTFIVHNHLPINCFNVEDCGFAIPPELGQLQHYRSGCKATLKKEWCEELMKSSVQDAGIWRYKQDLIARSLRTLNDLGYSAEYLATLVEAKHEGK